MQKHCILILHVRQAALSVAHTMRWRCMCHCILMLFLAYPVDPTGCGAATLFIQNIAEKESINVEKMLFTSKLKPLLAFGFSPEARRGHIEQNITNARFFKAIK